MLVFLLDCLCFSKLLKLHQTEGRISITKTKAIQQKNKHRVPQALHQLASFRFVIDVISKQIYFAKKAI